MRGATVLNRVSPSMAMESTGVVAGVGFFPNPLAAAPED
jgi:hypothetical protein